MRNLNLKIFCIVVVLGVVIAALFTFLRNPAEKEVTEPKQGRTTSTSSRAKRQERQEKFAKNIKRLTAGSAESRDLLQQLKKELQSGNEERIADVLTKTPSLEEPELLALALEGLKTIQQPEYRRDLVLALRSVTGRESLMILGDAMRDKDAEVRMAAVTSLALVDREMENLYEAAEKQLEAGKAISEDTRLPQLPTEEDVAKLEDSFLALANDENEDVRKELNSVLTMMSGNVQMAGYQAIAKSQFPAVRKDGLADLTGNMTKDKVAVLISYLDDQDEEIRGQAETFCEHFLGESFSSSGDAASWWRLNESRFNEDLTENEDGADVD